ncbi:hypothetical protein [Longimycelium tulufanense]|uniref:hypothetical protein n=1 Tax=Longimycelium tulufanense TaxID=907463 RepID=UPI0016692458|nr:hypothetical protein [Longimycelium tulufanense]
MPVSAERPPEAAELDFASILDDLCRTATPGDDRPWSTGDLARACQEQGQDITSAYIHQLRTGARDNPTIAHVHALAAALNVHPAALVGGTRRPVREGERAGWRPEAVDHLVQILHSPDSEPWTAQKIAETIAARQRWGKISTKHVRHLIRGHDNPYLRTVLALADCFHVPPAYFFDEEYAARMDADTANIKALFATGIRSLATRISRSAAHKPATYQAAVNAILKAREHGQTGDKT